MGRGGAYANFWKGTEGNKELLDTYYTLDTLSYILYIYTFIDSSNKYL